MQQARRPLEPHANRVLNQKIFIVLALPRRSVNEWRGPSPLLCAWAAQLRKNIATAASRVRLCADLSDPGIEHQTSRTVSVRLTTELTSRLWTGQLYHPAARVIKGIAIGAGGLEFNFQAYQIEQGNYVRADSFAFNHFGNRRYSFFFARIKPATKFFWTFAYNKFFQLDRS